MDSLSSKLPLYLSENVEDWASPWCASGILYEVTVSIIKPYIYIANEDSAPYELCSESLLAEAKAAYHDCIIYYTKITRLREHLKSQVVLLDPKASVIAISKLTVDFNYSNLKYKWYVTELSGILKIFNALSLKSFNLHNIHGSFYNDVHFALYIITTYSGLDNYINHDDFDIMNFRIITYALMERLWLSKWPMLLSIFSEYKNMVLYKISVKCDSLYFVYK